MQTQYISCPNCHSQNMAGGSTLCSNCGAMLPAAPMPMQQVGPGEKPAGAEKKLATGLCGILLGGLGVHKFLLGYNTEGTIMLVTYIAGLFLCGIPSLAVHVVGIIEGIIYLTKSDEEFVQTYIVNKKAWF